MPTDDSLTSNELFTNYQVDGDTYDELFASDGQPREHVAKLVGHLSGLGRERLLAAGARRDAIFMQQGITFALVEDGGAMLDRPFPLDLVPRVIPAAEWESIERGLIQRVRALNAFCDDIYHDAQIVKAGVIPWSLIAGRSEFARAAHGIRPPGGVYCHVAGCDLVRDRDGSWKVLEDNVRTPSGVSYVLENRRAMRRLVPHLFRDHNVRPVDDYPAMLLSALRSSAPASDEQPTVVVWTPGTFNSAYFEHAYLARQMGVELVEATDLVVRDNMCFINTTRGLARVHVIYRRIDDAYIDPIEFRPDSLLGIPGLMRAYRAGNVAIANAVGSGVADDKAVYPYVPAMIKFYLGEEAELDNVATYHLSDPEQLEWALARLDQLVVKPTSESGGSGVFIGPTATDAEIAVQTKLVRADPKRWIAQELVHLSTVPTVQHDGHVEPRYVDLRPFVVYGQTVSVIPGGLTRVALPAGEMIVNSSRGGGSKDTWVLDHDHDTTPPATPAPAVKTASMRSAPMSAWASQQQQQQQT